MYYIEMMRVTRNRLRIEPHYKC